MEIKDYKILDHPSDIKVWAFGKTKEELFLNMMRGMTAVLRPEILNSKTKILNKIEVQSIDLENLLVDFLSEVLYLSQINKRIYNDIKFFKFLDNGLEGELSGYEVESFDEEIKAVTHHDLKIEKQNNYYQATVLFDI